MNIERTYKLIKNNITYYIYKGTCQQQIKMGVLRDIPTKWITKNNKWDFKLTLKRKNGALRYFDSYGEEVMVWEEGEEEYHLY